MCKHTTDLIFIIENTSLTQFACVIYTVGVCVLGVVELGIVLQMVKVNYADKRGRVGVCVCVRVCTAVQSARACVCLSAAHDTACIVSGQTVM